MASIVTPDLNHTTLSDLLQLRHALLTEDWDKEKQIWVSNLRAMSLFGDHDDDI